MIKYALHLAYRGTQYCGWQIQKNPNHVGLVSIQGTITQALTEMTGESASLVGSGRTDSGVHAVGQIAHFVLRERDWDPAILKKGLNSKLPPDIRVQNALKVPIEFHAQRSAVKKQYSYYFLQGPCPLPHLELYSYWIRKKLDTKALQEALDHLRGRHDFKSFQAAGSKPGSTEREIFEAQVHVEPIAFPGGDLREYRWVRLRLLGSGFLKQMVRGIAGTLLQIGDGRRPPDCIPEILMAMDRKLVGPTAPARALWLEQVWYPEEFGI